MRVAGAPAREWDWLINWECADDKQKLSGTHESTLFIRADAAQMRFNALHPYRPMMAPFSIFYYL